MKTGFCRDLAFRVLPGTKLVVLTEALTYDSPGGLGYYAIPAGFACDLASVPKVIASLAPDWRSTARAGVLHDAAYRRSGFGVSRATADSLLFEALLCDGTDRSRAWAMYAAVRVFARGSYHAKPFLDA